MTTLEKYIWVVNVLNKAGDRGLSLKELSEAWSRNVEMSRGERLSRQTFDRWKGNILMTFGVDIDCRLRGGYRYYIKNPDTLRKGGLCGWLLDTYSTANTLSHNMGLKNRILVEKTPSSHDFLTDIIDIMKENRVMNLTYKNFWSRKPHTFAVAPYCLKMCQRRWYLLALSIEEARVRIYALDRMERVEMTAEAFSLPADFDAETYFATFFGVVLDESVPVERIVLRADSSHQHYLRTLPLHESQREINTCDDYADFELTLRPTYDFCMELLRVGGMIEVLEPKSLRHAMHEWVKDLWEMYKND
ncbi:MAG: WYL domain-containing protein [Bacteroidales bacterium]|nr:WYL domain-containing protein [Bacteroidales bacterium]